MVKSNTKKAAQAGKSAPVPQSFFLLVALNAKYVHTNLAVRYLKNNCKQKCTIKEYSINDEILSVCSDIFKTGIKNILFSCYIWNISAVLKICEILKKADKTFVITLGGPEVSFDAGELLEKYDFIDYIVCGEGEQLTDKLAQKILSNDKEEQIISQSQPLDFEKINFPYENEDIKNLKGRILYYETQRGCPYNCAFCLSGQNSKVRYLPIERVKKELSYFMENEVELVKFVDRTFNSNAKRALEIIEYIKKNNKKTKFHFEIKAEIMTEELLHSLSSAPDDMFQIEIGVQSTNEKTLEAINRRADKKKLEDVVKKLRKNDNIHLHLDLIAGLPTEDISSFICSFNDVFKLKAHDLQLGFLKKLKGASIKTDGSEFSSFPPYEVIKSDKMSYSDILRLKKTENVLEKYYNSTSFAETISYITEKYFEESPFDFFDNLGQFFDENNFGALSKKSLFEILYDYSQKVFNDKEITKLLILDYCKTQRDNLSFMENCDLKEKAFEFLKKKENIEKYLFQHNEKRPTVLFKRLRFIKVFDEIYLFDYIYNKRHIITREILNV